MSIAARHVTPGGYVGGSRKASEILGFMVHMAEGRNVAYYLSMEAAILRGRPGKPEPPGRNVSVHFTVEDDGTITSMVDELLVAGSLNPAALRSGDSGYYGRSHLDYVLGKAHVGNPNHYVIAVEVAGTARKGPNPRQVAALVRLFRYCRRKYPRIKPLGHRDQQNVKPCPGATSAMRLAFASMGGHGKDYKPTKTKPPVVVPPPVIPDPACAAQLAAATDRIADLEDQQEALEAAVASAMKALAGVAPGGET